MADSRCCRGGRPRWSALSGSTVTVALTGSRRAAPGTGSWRPSRVDGPCGQAPDRGDHPLLAVVEPVALVCRSRSSGADLVEQLEEAALADPRRAEERQEVAVPELGDADADARHAEHVVAIAVVLLHLDAGEDQRALVVDVACVGDVGGRHGVAAVGQVRLREDGVAVDAGVVDRLG